MNKLNCIGAAIISRFSKHRYKCICVREKNVLFNRTLIIEIYEIQLYDRTMMYVITNTCKLEFVYVREAR